MQSRFSDFLASIKRKTYLVVEKKIHDLYGIHADNILVIPGGELVKTRQMKEFVEDALLAKGISKSDVIVAVGGGSLLDLVGFVASTLLRGIDFITVPTTLLAMVDASIGGKTAINTPYGKNLIGAFHMPIDSYVDFTFLDTLPEEEFLMGMAEVIKYGLVFDKQLFEEIENKSASLEKIVLRSREIKQEIVAKDPMDKGIRHILNFGHTVGHALEFLHNYELKHGFAVASGLVFELALSIHEGYCSSYDLDRLKELLQMYKFPLQSFCKKLLYSAMLKDKKNRDGEVYFVLLHEIGRCVEKQGKYSFPIPKETLWSIA
ncbi:MAG: 3-dehydroquinate synthase [Chlamydiae bacterium]|nr:3-dehydroquinate synthase [Chlamydiota bacterium]